MAPEDRQPTGMPAIFDTCDITARIGANDAARTFARFFYLVLSHVPIGHESWLARGNNTAVKAAVNVQPPRNDSDNGRPGYGTGGGKNEYKRLRSHGIQPQSRQHSRRAQRLTGATKKGTRATLRFATGVDANSGHSNVRTSVGTYVTCTYTFRVTVYTHTRYMQVRYTRCIH